MFVGVARSGPKWPLVVLLRVGTVTQAVLLDFEKAPNLRPVRLAAPSARVGDPVRVGMSGAEIEGRISATSGFVLHVKVKATQLRAERKRRTKTA